MRSPAAGAATVLALAGGGILMTATAAAAAPATSWSSSQVNYSCSLSGYGQGMAPLPVSASVSSPDSMTAGASQSVKLVTSAIQIPAAIASQLSQISSISLAGTSLLGSASGGNAGQTALTGQSSMLGGTAGSVTQIPSMTATGTVKPMAAGSWNVAAPQSFQLQPMQGTTKLAPMTCTAAKAVSVPFTVIVSGAPGAGNATQVFSCTLTAAGRTMGTSQVPMKLGYSGKAVAGTPENVWMSSASSALSGSGLGGSQLASVTPMATSAGLGLSGGSSGSVPLSWSAGSAQGGQLLLAGKWMPKSAGMTKLSAPHEFSMKARMQSTTLLVVCHAVTPQTTTVTVPVQAVSTQAAGAAVGGMGTTANAGAPNTGAGGSLSPAVDVGLAAVGALVVLGGAGIGTLALRRRRNSAL